jgi:hypothetical protein
LDLPRTTSSYRNYYYATLLLMIINWQEVISQPAAAGPMERATRQEVIHTTPTSKQQAAAN